MRDADRCRPYTISALTVVRREGHMVDPTVAGSCALRPQQDLTSLDYGIRARIPIAELVSGLILPYRGDRDRPPGRH